MMTIFLHFLTATLHSPVLADACRPFPIAHGPRITIPQCLDGELPAAGAHSTSPPTRLRVPCYVIPGHGRIGDEADLVEYRDMVHITRDRLETLAGKEGLTPDQVTRGGRSSDGSAGTAGRSGRGDVHRRGVRRIEREDQSMKRAPLGRLAAGAARRL
ncbi:MAG: hypothetical protein HY657_17040 [Acidobacteria bacterium]|nr:hypothetical protein [Acidobacteriota bacterium]